jgi:hypothetical protein
MILAVVHKTVDPAVTVAVGPDRAGNAADRVANRHAFDDRRAFAGHAGR